MITFGEAVTNSLRFYQNPGSEQIGLDQELREKAAYYGNLIAKRAYTLAPYWWKHASGSVSVVAGVGTMPADFGTFGTEGSVWVNGQPIELVYMAPDALEACLKANPNLGSFPTHYTLSGKTTAGLSQIKTYPKYTGNLDLNNYDKRCPDLIDFPIPPAAADGGGAGNLNGSYTWRVTFVHPTGETEGGTITTAVSLSNRNAALTVIPVSPMHPVTARKVYRTAAGGIQHKLAGTVADNLTTTFTDNLADGSLGANAPTAASGAVSGLELFPEDFHEELFVEGIATKFARPEGDMRESSYMAEIDKVIKRMWAHQKQGQNVPQGMPPYGRGRTFYRRPRLLA